MIGCLNSEDADIRGIDLFQRYGKWVYCSSSTTYGKWNTKNDAPIFFASSKTGDIVTLKLDIKNHTLHGFINHTKYLLTDNVPECESYCFMITGHSKDQKFSIVDVPENVYEK